MMCGENSEYPVKGNRVYNAFVEIEPVNMASVQSTETISTMLVEVSVVTSGEFENHHGSPASRSHW
jgi:hypothetical protein